MKVTISFGSTNNLTVDVPAGTTVGQVLSNTGYQATLGFGTNVAGHVCGAPQPSETRLYEGAVLVVHNKENKKAN